MYSIMAFGVAASMYFFLKRRFWAYIIATLWALYSHHFAFFAIFVQGLWFVYEFLFSDRKKAKKRLKAFMYVSLGYLPWVYPLYTQTKMVVGGFWLGKPTTKDLGKLIFEYLAAGISNKNLLIPIIDKPIFLAASYLVVFSLIFRKWLKNIKKTAFLLLWFLIPIGATWLISQYFQSIFFNRYLLYTIPAAMLILASNRRFPLSNILIGATIISFVAIDYHYFTNPTKPPFRELSNYVKEVKNENDYLINWNAASHHLWETKYYGIPAPIYIPPDRGELPFFVGTALMEEGDVIHIIPENVQRVGITTSGPVDEVSLPGYTELEAKKFKGINFLWYQKQ